MWPNFFTHTMIVVENIVSHIDTLFETFFCIIIETMFKVKGQQIFVLEHQKDLVNHENKKLEIITNYQ